MDNESGDFEDSRGAATLNLANGVALGLAWALLATGCAATSRSPQDSPTAVVECIAEIPTRFELTSECDRQLLITAAAKVVAQNKQEIEDFLAGRPTPEDRAR